MLNETFDGPVFRHVHSSRGKLRDLDDSRIVLLNSGRWDGIITVGSLSNPHSREWEAAWGKETAGGIPAAEVDAQGKRQIKFFQGGLGEAVSMVFGDFHRYPRVPWNKEDRNFYRTHASGAKPVFLSEVGTGSLPDVIHGLLQYQSADPLVRTNRVLSRKSVQLAKPDGITSPESGGAEAAKWQIAIVASPLVGADPGWSQVEGEMQVNKNDHQEGS